MNISGIKEQIDHYAIGDVKQLNFCGNGMSAVFNSNTFENIWYKLEEKSDGKCYYRGKEVVNKQLPVKTNALHCKLLHENVKNPFQDRIDYGRSKGVKVWLSMRMNDIHWITDDNFLLNTEYFRGNPQLRRAAYNTNDWSAQALDYGKDQVRQHFLALAKEYIERFDLDGLELDWMRSPSHLRPGFELQDAHLITEFMRDVREISNKAQEKRGHEIKIGVRLPSRPEDARLSGFDFISWAKEKLVDSIAITPYWASTDFNMPIEIWRELLPENISLSAGLEILVRPNVSVAPFMNTAEMVAGFVCTFLYQGADDIYLFNHMDGLVGMKDKQEFNKMLEDLKDIKETEKLPRRHVVTFTDKKGRAEGLAIDNILPAALSKDIYYPIRINIGGGAKGRDAVIVLGINSSDAILHDSLIVRLNTCCCSEESKCVDLEMPENDWKILAYKVPKNALHDGNSMIEIIKTIDLKIIVEWCEVYIA